MDTLAASRLGEHLTSKKRVPLALATSLNASRLRLHGGQGNVDSDERLELE